MTSSWVQPRDRIFVKGYGFLFFAWNMGKNKVKNLVVNKAQNFLIMLKNMLQMPLKLL